MDPLSAQVVQPSSLRSRSTRSLSVALAGLVALPVHASTAPPTSESQPEDESSEAASPDVDIETARRLFRDGVRSYEDEDYAAAVQAFEESFAVAKSPEAAFNLARSYDRLGADVETARWCGTYIHVAQQRGIEVDPWVANKAMEMRARLGELRLVIESSDAVDNLWLNGEKVELSDFPRIVRPGTIAVRLAGTQPGEVFNTTAEVAPGGTWTIQFTGFPRAPTPPETTRKEPPAPLPTPVTTPEPPRKALRPLFWTSLGLTGVSAITVAAAGGMVVRHRERWANHLCAAGHICQDQYTQAAAEAAAVRRFSVVTNVMLGVTAGLAILTTALGIAMTVDQKKGQARPRRASQRIRAVSAVLAGMPLEF